jgi:hypothetical protein
MLNPRQCQRLYRIADLIDAERETWLEGHAVRDSKGRWNLPDNTEMWLHVRCHKLEIAARDLRAIALKHTAEDYSI